MLINILPNSLSKTNAIRTDEEVENQERWSTDVSDVIFFVLFWFNGFYLFVVVVVLAFDCLIPYFVVGCNKDEGRNGGTVRMELGHMVWNPQRNNKEVKKEIDSFLVSISISISISIYLFFSDHTLLNREHNSFEEESLLVFFLTLQMGYSQLGVLFTLPFFDHKLDMADLLHCNEELTAGALKSQNILVVHELKQNLKGWLIQTTNILKISQKAFEGIILPSSIMPHTVSRWIFWIKSYCVLVLELLYRF